MTSIVIPIPFGPRNTTLVASWTKGRENSSSMSARSMRLGQFQSKSAMGLNAPMRALVRRRSRERRFRSRSSMSMTCSIHGWANSASSWTARPFSPRARRGCCTEPGSYVWLMFVGSVWRFVGGGGIVVHAVVVGEVVRSHVQRAKPRVVGKREGQRGGGSDCRRCWSMRCRTPARCAASACSAAAMARSRAAGPCGR